MSKSVPGWIYTVGIIALTMIAIDHSLPAETRVLCAFLAGGVAGYAWRRDMESVK